MRPCRAGSGDLGCWVSPSPLRNLCLAQVRLNKEMQTQSFISHQGLCKQVGPCGETEAQRGMVLPQGYSWHLQWRSVCHPIQLCPRGDSGQQESQRGQKRLGPRGCWRVSGTLECWIPRQTLSDQGAALCFTGAFRAQSAPPPLPSPTLEELHTEVLRVMQQTALVSKG